jgi:hypothetical protein
VKRFAVVALVLLTACAGSPNQRPKTKAHATTTTASTSTTTTSTTAIPATTSTSAVLARACSADDLGIVGTLQGAGMSHTGLFLRLENLSATECSLSGDPITFNATTTDGKPLVDYKRGSYFGEPEPGNLGANSCCGLLRIETSMACGDGAGNPPNRTYRDIRIGMPGGGTLSLGDMTVTTNCDIWVSKLGIERVQ